VCERERERVCVGEKYVLQEELMKIIEAYMYTHTCNTEKIKNEEKVHASQDG
jgi:hypothetical protein